MSGEITSRACRPVLPAALPTPLDVSASELVPLSATPGLPPELVARRVEKPTVEALAPARYKVQFTAGVELHDKLERLATLLRSEIHGGDVAAVIDYAVTQTLRRLEARRFGKTAEPRKTLAATDTSGVTRAIPAAVRRMVHERDGSRCRFVDEQGRRCSERHRLEFHHRHPFGLGGDHSPGNVSLLCREHNRLLAEHDYGKAAMRRHLPGDRRTEGDPERSA